MLTRPRILITLAAGLAALACAGAAPLAGASDVVVIWHDGLKPVRFTLATRVTGHTFHWTSWTTRKAVGSGTISDCAFNGSRCDTEHDKLTLTKPAVRCGELIWTHVSYGSPATNGHVVQKRDGTCRFVIERVAATLRR